MTIMELGALGEFLGSVGVIATLAYLAVQIRQNTRATQTASHHAITDSLNQGNVAQATDPELARIWLVGCEDRASLSDVDRHRLDMLLLAYFHVFDSLFYSASRGTGERSLLVADAKSVAHLMSLPGVRAWWDARGRRRPRGRRAACRSPRGAR